MAERPTIRPRAAKAVLTVSPEELVPVTVTLAAAVVAAAALMHKAETVAAGQEEPAATAAPPVRPESMAELEELERIAPPVAAVAVAVGPMELWRREASLTP
jgi:hypothetical protein